MKVFGSLPMRLLETHVESLDVNNNGITSKGLTAITRLLDSTQLQTIAFVDCNRHVFEDTDATQHFVTTLQQRNSSLQALPSITPHDFPEDDSEQRQAATCASINESLTRNQQLHRVNNLLLAPPPGQQQPQPGGTTMMVKTLNKATTTLAKVPSNAGATAIFKLLTARPQLLAKRIKRPAAAAPAAPANDEQKRRRLQDS
jgi:hypothetical protein